MKVKMKSTQKGSTDGVTVKEYEKGKTYDVPEALANAFINADFATEVKKGAGPSNNKSANGAPDNNQQNDQNQQPPANDGNQQQQ